MPLVIGIVSPKGGSGKTTTAVHLARAIQATGDDVVILDTDPQGSAHAWSRKREEGPLVPVVHADTDDVGGTLQDLARSPDVVVIDGPAKAERRTKAILQISDVALIPVQPKPLDSWGVEQVVETVRAANAPAAFVVTQQKPHTKLASEIAEGLEEWYNLPVLDARLSDRAAYAEAMFDGITALDISDAPKAKTEVRALTHEFEQFLQDNT